jgi:hypothetical protein
MKWAVFKGKRACSSLDADKSLSVNYLKTHQEERQGQLLYMSENIESLLTGSEYP